PATTPTSTLSLHDALPISRRAPGPSGRPRRRDRIVAHRVAAPGRLQRGSLEPRAAAVSAATLPALARGVPPGAAKRAGLGRGVRSEEHTSELQSRSDLVCR